MWFLLLFFFIAKATYEDASNHIVSSETNPDIGRVPTARNREQLFCKDMWFHILVWDGVKQNEPTKLTASWNHHQALWNKTYLEFF